LHTCRGDRVDQVQTIRQMSSVWLWEAVQRVLKATFEILCICWLCLRPWITCIVSQTQSGFGCVPLGWSGTWGSVIQDLCGSWCIKGIGEYTLVMDSPVLLIHHDETDLGSPILIQITPKERTLWSLEFSVIICTLNRQWESHAGPHLKIGGCACWLWYTCPLSCIMHYCQALCMIMTITQKSWSCLECHNVCQSL